MKRDVLLNQGITLYFYFFIGYRLAVGWLVLTPLTLTALFTPKSSKLLPQGSGFKHRGKFRDKGLVLFVISLNLSDLTVHLRYS